MSVVVEPTEQKQSVRLRRHCWILVSGFDGVVRVISLFRQRRYRVVTVAAAPKRAPTWTLTVVIDTTQHDDETNLLVKRLNRLPDVLKVHYGHHARHRISVWD